MLMNEIGDFIEGGYVKDVFAALAVIFASIPIKFLLQAIDFLKARKFIKKNGYVDSIRDDFPDFRNCKQAYRYAPGCLMNGYLEKLNPYFGKSVRVSRKKYLKKKWEERIRNLPYWGTLFGVIMLLTLACYNWGMDENAAWIILCVVGFLMGVVFFCNKGWESEFAIISAILLAGGTMLIEDYVNWVHAAICVGVAAVGALFGCLGYKRK